LQQVLEHLETLSRHWNAIRERRVTNLELHSEAKKQENELYVEPCRTGWARDRVDFEREGTTFVLIHRRPVSQLGVRFPSDSGEEFVRVTNKETFDTGNAALEDFVPLSIRRDSS
jgi:hypothetical protein